MFVESEASLEYDAGTLTLSDVRYPTTIEVRVKKRTEPKNPVLTEPCAHVGGVLLTDLESGSFTIPYESQPLANYVETGYHVILYRTNGGVTSDGKDFYYRTFSDAHFQMPNTLHQNGTFTREGYVLMRYTAEADGSGDFTTLGGKIMPNSQGFVELWCS